MGEEQFAVVVTALVLAAAISVLCVPDGCAATTSGNEGIKIASFSTDKDIYSANEQMLILLSVYAPEDIPDVVIEVEGVKSKSGANKVYIKLTKNLTAGKNMINCSQQLPSCSHCAGIDQGTYYIEATVKHGTEELQATHSIAITSAPDQVIPVDVVVEETRRMVESTSDGLILVDVRNATDFDAAHIKGAISLPLANFTNSTAALNKSDKIVVYSEDGANSTIATGILIEQGFERVYNVVGGMNAWNESGYPKVSTAEENPAAPGFELALALVAVLLIAYRVRRRAV